MSSALHITCHVDFVPAEEIGRARANAESTEELATACSTKH